MIQDSLWVMIYGMGGIFLVMGVITGVISLFSLAGKGRKRKSGRGK